MSYPIPVITTALWLGIMVSLSPCPFATNILAITFLGRGSSDKISVFYKGLFYTLGRAISYLILGYILVEGLLSIPQLSRFLQRDFNRILGPVLMIAGAGMLGVFHFPSSSLGFAEKVGQKLSGMGLGGCALLGFLFAFSFCPVSAAIFFGSLIPLSIKYHAFFSGPLIFSIGTSLPVIISAYVLSWGVGYVGRLYEKVQQMEKWFRRGTGVLFLIGGVYFVLEYF